MITRIVKLTLHGKFSSDFENIFSDRNQDIKSQKGCRDVKLVKDVNKPGVFFTISQWDSERDLNAYRHSEIFKDIWPKVKPMFSEKAEAWSTTIC